MTTLICNATKIMWRPIAEKRGGTPIGGEFDLVMCCKGGEHLYHKFELKQEATQLCTLVYLEMDKYDTSK